MDKVISFFDIRLVENCCLDCHCTGEERSGLPGSRQRGKGSNRKGRAALCVDRFRSRDYWILTRIELLESRIDNLATARRFGVRERRGCGGRLRNAECALDKGAGQEETEA